MPLTNILATSSNSDITNSFHLNLYFFMLENSPLIPIATLAPFLEMKRGNRNYKSLVLAN